MYNPMEMPGKTVLVTGASAGIGKETSILLSRLGASVVLVGRDMDRLRKVLSCLEGKGHRIECFDLTHTDAIPDWLKGICAESGPLSGIVHCAGIQNFLPLRSLNADAIESVLNINLKAAISLARGFRLKNVHAETGSLVLVSSVMGLVGGVGRSVYSASKGALNALARSLSLELAREGIRVNCVAPAFVKTEMWDQICQSLGPEQTAAILEAHPLGLGEPRDVADSIAFLLADSSRWITGSILVVDGGYTAR